MNEPDINEFPQEKALHLLRLDLTPLIVSQRPTLEHFLLCPMIIIGGVELKRGDRNCSLVDYNVDDLENINLHNSNRLTTGFILKGSCPRIIIITSPQSPSVCSKVSLDSWLVTPATSEEGLNYETRPSHPPYH